jgi:hypothetical protein
VKGGLSDIHPSAQNEFLINGAKWFTPDYGYAGQCLKQVRKEYKKWLELAKRQKFFAKSNFNKSVVTKKYQDVLTEVDTLLEAIPKPMELKLPKLQKL